MTANPTKRNVAGLNAKRERYLSISDYTKARVDERLRFLKPEERKIDDS